MANLRKHILIHPSFQVRFAGFFTLSILVFASIFPIFVYTLFESMETHAVFSRNPSGQQALTEARYDMIIFFLVVTAVIILTSFLVALFQSHRIAGPLYKLRMSMVAMQQGVLNHHIKFRARDNFPELADGFNNMMDAIFIRRRRDFEKINSVIPKLERLQLSLSGEDQASVTEVLNTLQELSRELPMK